MLVFQCVEPLWPNWKLTFSSMTGRPSGRMTWNRTVWSAGAAALATAIGTIAFVSRPATIATLYLASIDAVLCEGSPSLAVDPLQIVGRVDGVKTWISSPNRATPSRSVIALGSTNASNPLFFRTPESRAS